MAGRIAVDKATQEEMVDVPLAYHGTPRHRLFEYPYRADESRALIREAEFTVSRLVGILSEAGHNDADCLAA